MLHYIIRTIHSLAEVEPLLAQVRSAADQTAQAIRGLVDAEPDGIEVLRRMKFTKIARHPLADRPLNLSSRSTRPGHAW
jgi:hypothetical protein